MASNSVEAHNAYLQGHFHFVRRNVEDFRKAIDYFDQAIQLDPNYALAYAERAEAWAMIGDLTGQRPTAYPKARSDAEKAVAIAPIWRRRARLSAGSAFLVIGNLLKALAS